MNKNQKSQFEVWAQLCVSHKCVLEIHRFFRDEYGIKSEHLFSNLHLTVYHARRPMHDVETRRESCRLSIDTLETRFMVLAPGGENPRDYLVPADRRVGIRIKKTAELRRRINDYRSLLTTHETQEILGTRNPSTNAKSAFGARSFQPHISFLKAGSGIKTDLKEVGENFRNTIQDITFDQFVIEKRKNF